MIFQRLFSWFESRVPIYPDTPPLSPKNGIIHFIWSNTDGVRPWLLLMAILVSAVGIMEALVFQFVGNIVDWLAQYSPDILFVEKGWQLLGMLMLMALLVVTRFFSSTIRLQTLQGVFPMRLRWKFHRLMLNQSLGFYQDEFAGRVASKVMQTALSVRDTVMTSIEMFIYAGVYFITSGIIITSLDVWLLLPFGIWMILFIMMMVMFIPKVSRASKKQADARSLMTGRITDAYSNIAVVKLFSHGAREADYAKDSMQEFMQTVYAQMRLINLLSNGCSALNTALISATAALGIVLWQQGAIGIGALATATAMALRINGFAQYIMWEFAHLFEHIGTVADGMGTLSKPHTVTDKIGALPISVDKGEICFKNVDFHYDEAKPLLNHFNLTIKAGEKVGLIGRSGAGKSTIVNLLLRFYDTQSGTIMIDGQRVDEVSQESLRAKIGLVTQDTSLLHRSVRENIIYGRPDATEAEMVDAAERAEAADFIPQLSDVAGRHGYEAHVGERGVKLSGGQRQRIAIARVMLKNAPILVLDEATSALDSEVEAAIQNSLDKMMEGKTVIAIAHRLSTIAAMDRLIVLDNGHIVEEGTHTELLALGGLYAKLWAHQSGGFLPQHIVE